MINHLTDKWNQFDIKVDVRINTVNCVGIMGKGLALEFKKRYPEMYTEYVNVCRLGDINPSQPFVWNQGDLLDPVIIINLPTKIHWRNPSKYSYIESNLKWLRHYLADKGSVSVALPPLGCGNGGLQWLKVKGLIDKYLSDTEALVFVFPPSEKK